MVNVGLRQDQLQCTSPEPALLTLHCAPPAISTFPEPAMSTEAVLVAWAETFPDPAMETVAVSLATCLASMSPDPAISYSAFLARP